MYSNARKPKASDPGFTVESFSSSGAWNFAARFVPGVPQSWACSVGCHEHGGFLHHFGDAHDAQKLTDIDSPCGLVYQCL